MLLGGRVPAIGRRVAKPGECGHMGVRGTRHLRVEAGLQPGPLPVLAVRGLVPELTPFLPHRSVAELELSILRDERTGCYSAGQSGTATSTLRK